MLPESSFFGKKEKYTVVAIFILLWAYVFLKASFMGLFHDEITTFYFHTQTGQIFSENAHFDANNHYLNSVLSRWSYLVFGPSPLALRLPNVLAFALFFYATYKLSAQLKDWILRWSFLLSVSMCGFIFEYFAECRGYGLAIAFMMAGIWMLTRYLNSRKILHLVLMGATLWFSVFSNLTILVTSVLIFAFVIVNDFLKDFKLDKKAWLKRFLLTVALGIPFLYHAKCALKLKEGGMLVHGSLESLYKTTIESVSLHTLGVFNDIIGWTVLILFWLVVLVLIIRIVQKKNIKFIFTGEGFFIYQLVISILAVFLMAKIMEVNYPMDRVGMNLLIFLMGGFVFTLSYLNDKYKWTRFFVLIMLVIPGKFIIDLNPYGGQNWNTWRHSQGIYNNVSKYESNFKFPLIISSWMRQDLPWYYVNYLNGGEQSGAYFSGYPVLEADFIIKGPEDENWLTPQIPNHFDSIYYDENTEVTLWKRTEFLKKELIEVQSFEDVTSSDTDYLTFCKFNADSLQGETLYIGCEMTLDAETAPFRSRLVVGADDVSEGVNLYQEFVQLDWLKPKYKGEQNNVEVGALISAVPEKTEEVSMFLWNIDRTPFSIRNGKCYLYRLVRDF